MAEVASVTVVNLVVTISMLVKCGVSKVGALDKILQQT
jgi:hypothetical protein